MTPKGRATLMIKLIDKSITHKEMSDLWDLIYKMDMTITDHGYTHATLRDMWLKKLDKMKAIDEAGN